jgi:hypothetical protein
MDRVLAEFPRDPDELRTNVEAADGVRATCVEHSIEDDYSDSRFRSLTFDRLCSCSIARPAQA